ncbi:uncharacterized protein LOC123970405 [Micropterus dolomieu]|uniref:uncharacterized protein LOC123970405 n=1 Tax=Micropterus dolomieu TaxID=147949 RepID=UPI001E8CB400|nr:uncharacterized protein LOC123970405 [Micropterus dolomieu]XP_045904394.1 uncharacterized protein LOC123970405 [Micropterus dolomieu]
MNINTTFATTEDEIMNFVAILIYMGIAELPSVDDYWAMETRVSQVAKLMSSKRFKLLKRVVHFNNNDRFFKVWPLFNYLVTAFRKEPETPKQSVDEVMVAYKGKTAGNLRQYIKSKPDKWGFIIRHYIPQEQELPVHRNSQGQQDWQCSTQAHQKEMMKKAVPRGTCDYITSDDGILMVRWKDNKVVTLMSTDMGVEPWSSVYR